MSLDLGRRFGNQRADQRRRRHLGLAEALGIEIVSCSGNRLHRHACGDGRFVGDKAREFCAQGIGERRRKGRQKNTRLRIDAGEMGGAMQGDNCLAGSGRTGYPRRAGVITCHQTRLRRVQKHCPFIPWIIQRLSQFLDIC